MPRKLDGCRLMAMVAFVALTCLALAGALPGASSVALAEPQPQPQSQTQTPTDAVALDAATPDDDAAAGTDTDPDPDPDEGGDVAPTGTVTATLSTDERRVALTGSGGVFDDAERVVFHVWQGGVGPMSLIRHEAVQLDDGSWSATAFIAANNFLDPGVPYNCQVPNAVHRLYNRYTGQHFFTANVGEADALSRGGWSYEGVAWVYPQETVEPPEDAPAPDVPDAPDDTPTDAPEGTPGDAPADTPADTPGDDPTDTPVDTPVDDPVTDPEGGAGDEAKPVQQPVYRLYNPYSGDHFLTTNPTEYEALGNASWRQEGIAFHSEIAPSDGGPEGTVTVYRLYNPYISVGSHHFTTSLNEYETLKANGWRGEGIAWYGAGVNPDGSWSSEAQGRYHDYSGTYWVEAYVTPAASDDPAPSEPVPSDPEVPEPAPSAPGVDDSGDPGDAEGDPLPTDPSEGEAPGDPADTDVPSTDDPASKPEPEPEPEPEPVEPVVVGQASFTVTAPRATARVANVNNAWGTYDVFVEGISSPSGVARVQVPTWTDARGQDDLVWYDASREGNGSYKATVNVNRHTFDGDFTSHAYVVAGNGVMANVAQLSQHLTFANYVKHTNGPNRYTVSIFNPGPVSRVRMPTWSAEGGQDDIVWYEAHDEGNGWWTATIDASRLIHSGTVHVHIYADDSLRNAVDLQVQPWEILPLRYRNMYDRVWNLSSPSRWLLAVDTTNCFVGVFEGSRGNWTNRAWWACAPGTWATPTVKGVFSIGYRGYVFGNGFSCYYYTQFYGGYWFHSIQYYPGTFNVMDGTLGMPRSHGCVRLALENARWINQNIPSGTTVLVY